MTLDKATVMAALRAEDVAAHLGITGTWRGRWMRSSRCATADHGADAFGIARDGMWHCWACDKGGDLLRLIATAEKLDMREDFPKILEIAAGIAGVEDDDSFGMAPRPAPKPRAPLPEVIPLVQRVALARKRGAWVWNRLMQPADVRFSVADSYLRRVRMLDPDILRAREDIRETPLRCTMEEMFKSPDLKTLAWMFATPGVAVPVRCASTGSIVDVRVRRAEPRPDQPKIVGMLGGVTSGPAESGRPRTLVGCYGHPESVDAPTVVVVEGLVDYLTALQVWPDAQILGAVEAGSFDLVAGHAARALAARDSNSTMILVEQHDPEGTHRDGTTRIGAADAAVNENPNSAAKVAIRILGPSRVGWLFCGGPAGTKDLNDLVRAGCAPEDMVRWA